MVTSSGLSNAVDIRVRPPASQASSLDTAGQNIDDDLESFPSYTGDARSLRPVTFDIAWSKSKHIIVACTAISAGMPTLQILACCCSLTDSGAMMHGSIHPKSLNSELHVNQQLSPRSREKFRLVNFQETSTTQHALCMHFWMSREHCI